uniref:ArfGAP with RhoGAP domain, ankyrin repeat and PH domain 1 n=1 Tax=Poecilia formosa TaxID=48698 RepID=A0A096LS99_POEFO
MSLTESSANVSDWLSTLRLEQYGEAFQEAGLTKLQDCQNLTTDQLDRMGINLPGHQKRILANLSKMTVSNNAYPNVVKPESSEQTSRPEVKRKEKPVPVPAQRKVEEVNCHPTPIVSPLPDASLPPVPPRSTPNCPPQPFVSSPAQHSGSLSLDRIIVVPPPEVKYKSSSQKSTPTSTFVSTEAPVQTDKSVPPLPPKAGSKGPPPIPQRVPLQSPKTHSGRAVPPLTKKGTEELIQTDPTPQVPLRNRRPQAQEISKASEPTELQPALPVISCMSFDDSSNDYVDTDLLSSSVQQRKVTDRDMSLQVPNHPKKRVCSLYSDDELLDEDEPWDSGEALTEETCKFTFHSSVFKLHIQIPDSGRLSTPVKEDTSQLSSVIKMGWLDKNPPQGALYYQRRWVKLEVDYLRYFDNEKEVYSKGFISTAFITSVSSVGEVKFEVATKNRTFIFRAENEDERNEWLTELRNCTGGPKRPLTLISGSPLTPDYSGYLELRGLRSKLFTVVASDKVLLYKNAEDYNIGVGITFIDMNVGNVKDSDRRSFDLTTPYRIFSFIAESEQSREQWVQAMRNAIGEALSNSEVVEQIWTEPSNSFCADCGAPKPDWAAINLCVVICKQCAGEHRGLGPSISKVRSLKMDKKIWTEELIQVFLKLGNKRVNSFWAANVPPSEALSPSSCSEDRRRFISNKYRQGKYRKYHALYGNQTELNNALCINVQCSDLLETLSLIFCGADVNCSTGMANCPSPESLASAHSQPLQAELIKHNLNTVELPQLQTEPDMDLKYYPPPPCVSYEGYLFKTASMGRAVAERKMKEEFSRRWCMLNDGTFSYYEHDKSTNPNGTLKASEIVCLAVDAPEKHGYDFTFELYSESERIYLFGTDEPDSHKEWVKCIAKTFIPATAEPLLRLSFERIGRLKCKDGLNLQKSKVGWFALAGSTLHVYLENSKGEEIHLRKLNELSIQQDNEVLVLVEKGRTLYIEGERKLDFAGWCGAIQAAAGSGGDTLSQQQLTDTDIPVIVLSCIDYITQCGLTSEGIYRKSGVNSRVAALCDRFRRDARSLRLKEGEHQVDDVSNTLKRFFRELEEGLFTSEYAYSWLSITALQDENDKISEYKALLDRLPRVNKATLQALINHLYCVQRFSELNQMNLHNLAIVFGPTLFQTDGKDYTAGRAIEDLIQHYTLIFEVDEQQLDRQLKEIKAIIQMREGHPKFPKPGGNGHFICTVYLEELKDTAEQHVKIPGSMTAAELAYEVLDRRNIPVKDKDYWSCWEVCEEIERPLHYQERVLPILHSAGNESHLLIKKQPAMDAMINYLATKLDVSKNGMMKFREERSILGLGLPSGNFHDRYFILNVTSLRMYKDVRSHRAEREWVVKNLKIYLGIKKKLRPPTCWGLTVVCESKKQEKPERQQWYLCCETQSEMREWYATFLSIQNDGNIWPQDGVQQNRVSRALPDTRHGNVSLIPLRGSENEMRNSVAAFSQDALALLRDVR